MAAMIFVRLDASKNANTVAANIQNDLDIGQLFVVPNKDFQIAAVTKEGADASACAHRIDNLPHVTLVWTNNITG